MFRILHCLEQEPVGMYYFFDLGFYFNLFRELWKKLLFSVLSNCSIYLSSSLVQEIVESIMHVHFFQHETIEVLNIHLKILNYN